MKIKLAKADFFWPLAFLSLIAMVMLACAVFALVRQFDIAATQREQSVVENGIRGRVEEVAHMVIPQVMWDDAVRHLQNTLDASWAHDNIGQFLSQSDGFSTTFVLDADDKPIFAADQGVTSDARRYGAFAAGARTAVAAVRAVEQRRGPLGPPRHAGEMLAAPVQGNTIAGVNDELYILTATLVQPDFGTVTPRGARAPIVVTAMPLDQRFLDTIARRYMLEGPVIHNGATWPEHGEAHAAMRNAQGAVVATMEWRPQNPGQALLHNLILPILLVVAALGGVALFLYRRSRRMAQGLIASEARATHLAYYDTLTGLPNRVLFFDRLGVALDQSRRSGRTIAVHCVDLDRFKEVNDTFGHQVGDELIQEAARRMSAQCRTSDTFARLSGDEFAIVQTDATPASAAALAARLIEVMNRPVHLGAGRLFVSCSIGLSVIADGAVEPAEGLRQADLALYRAKQNGKGKYCFFEVEMDAAIKTRRALEMDLREALATNALTMVYQPQVNGRGVMTGVEALVRWRHPDRGDVAPSFFVPIAEECGLIVDLGMFTLRRAFEDSRRWGNLKIAVNISANQLRLKDFVSSVVELVTELNVDPRQFELEITEGVLLGDDPQTHDTLKRLRNLGFSLALDDFGTGYSSLSYLQRYPINKIKIDRSFIANLGLDGESDAVVGAIVKLARALKLSVIAEGVETGEQRDRLANVGCSEIQGFLYSRPVSAEDVDRLCETRKTALEPQAG